MKIGEFVQNKNGENNRKLGLVLLLSIELRKGGPGKKTTNISPTDSAAEKDHPQTGPPDGNLIIDRRHIDEKIDGEIVEKIAEKIVEKNRGEKIEKIVTKSMKKSVNESVKNRWKIAVNIGEKIGEKIGGKSVKNR